MRQAFVSVFLFVVGICCVALADDSPQSKAPGSGVNPAATQNPTPHESAVKQVTDALLKAYLDEDAKEFASAFTPDGEYVDANGLVFHGQKAIQDEFTSFFKDMPDSSMQIEFSAVRPIATGIIVSDCTTHFKKTAASSPILGRCQIVCTRNGDAWRIASLRETPAAGKGKNHHEQLSQLEWLIGEWIGESNHSHLHFSCRWDESGNYLLRDFSVQTGTAKPLTGTQRIGYDPTTGHLKIWVFDTNGGHADGYFNRDGEAWILRTSGVAPDGRMVSATNSFKLIDNHRISSEVIDGFVGGERVGEQEKITLIRKPTRKVNRTSHEASQSK